MLHIVLLGRLASWCQPALARRLRTPHSLTSIPDLARLEDFTAELARAHVLVGWPLTDALVARAPHLRLAQASGAGIDGLTLSSLPAQVRVANTFHHEAAMAEYALMAMLTLTRRPHLCDAQLRQGNWDGSCIWGETPTLRELRGQTALLIGTGHIAREIALRARAFGVRTIAVSRQPAHSAAEPFDEIIPYAAWHDRLPTTDFLIPCCPLTPDTDGLINTAVYTRLPRTAIVINIARGRVFDEQATFDALHTNRIAGAALDTWYRYPATPGESCHPSRLPFHTLPNVLLSPHNSAWTLPTITGRVEDIAYNIDALAEGLPLRNLLR